MTDRDQTTIRIQPCRERIVRTDFIVLAFNQDKLGVGGGKKRLVDLACGHKALTSSWRTAEIETGEEDHDAFRYHGGRDFMIWRDDPCRQFNEPTNLSGEFIND